MSFLNFFKKTLPETTKIKLSEEEVIELLKTSPEKLAEFEKYYHTEVLPNLSNSDNLFEVNAKQAAESVKNDVEITKTLSDSISNFLSDIIDRAVNELLSLTEVWAFDGKNGHKKHFTDSLSNPITMDEINAIPDELRPQLTGRFMHVDIGDETYKVLLWYLKKMQTSKNPREKQMLYHQFRQGLDILDIDPITAEIIGMNQNSMGHWLPQLAEANADKGFFKIPKTTIVKLPVTLLQLTRNDYFTLTASTKEIVNRWAAIAFDLHKDEDYFIKTGTYSSKYDFRNCRVCGPEEVMDIGEYLLYIHFSALQMASPLNNPVIYGVSTTNEWVVREFISDKEDNPSIYKGLPLHTEYRVFIDCDSKTVLGINPYWEPKAMKKRFAEHRDGHDVHDEIVFDTYETKLMSRYTENAALIKEKVQELIQDLDLHGQWSLDVMQNGDDFWLIDMAIAECSFGYDKAVPVEMRRPIKENWIPELPDVEEKR